MKRMVLALAALLAVSHAGLARATPITINDNYVGGNDHGFGDVIGTASVFDLTKMTVDAVGGSLQVDVAGNYFSNFASNSSGLQGTQAGDLFISTNGWHPYGAAPYVSDTAANGEGWEFALVLDNHAAGRSSGTVGLYAVNASHVIDSFHDGGTIRDGQEVEYDTNGQSALAFGTWSIFGLGTTTQADDFLRFTIASATLGSLGDLGFHWGMTCANDVIEGGAAGLDQATTPEPGSIALLGAGVLGFAARLRRRRAESPHRRK